MKTLKYTLLLLVFLIASGTFAQTKEETVKNINEIVKVSNGRAFKVNYGADGFGFYYVLDQSFSLNEFTYSYYDISPLKEKGNKKSKTTAIPWPALTTIERLDQETDADLVSFILTFNVNVDDIGNKKIRIFVIPSKATNVEKALKHLQELLKKEDPFGN